MFPGLKEAASDVQISCSSEPSSTCKPDCKYEYIKISKNIFVIQMSLQLWKIVRKSSTSFWVTFTQNGRGEVDN